MSDTVTISRLDYNVLIEATFECMESMCDGGEAEAAHGNYILFLEETLVRLAKEIT